MKNSCQKDVLICIACTSTYTPGQPTQIPAASEEDLDWWSKYYASIGRDDASGTYLACGFSKMRVLNGHLEDVDPFDRFLDFCHTFEITRPKKRLLNRCVLVDDTFSFPLSQSLSVCLSVCLFF